MVKKKEVSSKGLGFVPNELIETKIYLIRGKKVMLDSELARLYDVDTRSLNQAVRRNMDRFPDDFMFSLTREEIQNISQFVICSEIKHSPNVFAFTEQGVAMLSSVLRSKRAVQVNIAIMRTFARIREFMLSNADLRRKIDATEKRYDQQFAVVFEAIRKLLDPGEKKQKGPIGFQPRKA